MPISVRVRLSAMMFLQFLLFAVFWQPLAAYLSKLELSGTQMALILSSMAIGCLVSPIIGMIADRHFASEKVLFVLNLLGAILLFIAAKQQAATTVFITLLLYMLCYMPTWGLTSAIAMSNSPSEKFPQIRVFGSIGWFASGAFGLVALKMFGTKIDGTVIPLYCGAVTSLVAAALALTIPTTPPPAKGQKASVVDALGLRALSLLKDSQFALFIIITLLVMIPFSLYWSFFSIFLEAKGFQLHSATMNWGQFVEMFVMLLVPIVLLRIGIKWTMTIGLVALAARYLFLFIGSNDQIWAIYAGILVHGIIFSFFFVGSQIYVDKKAKPEIRAQAQGLLFLLSFGIGLLVGTFLYGKIIDIYTTEEAMRTAWDTIYLITTIISVVILAIFIVFFRDKLNQQGGAVESVEPEPEPQLQASKQLGDE
ncbi:MAG: MFS transporter [Planctomycetota bacterium]|jgi:nucleoside transporter